MFPRLIAADSESSADMLYATRFFAPDTFFFLEKKGKTMVVLSDLEIDRGRKSAKVGKVFAYSDVSARCKGRGESEPAMADVLARFLKEQRVSAVHVPASFPLGLATDLARRKIRLIPQKGAFWPERETKSPEEVRGLREALRITEAGMARAMDVLAAARIRPKQRLYWGGSSLTSERLRAEIDSAVLRAGGLPANTIVAGGNQACDPHERGSGPLCANTLIIIDIFPRAARTGYYGDLTRTVVRGRAGDKQRRLWETVLEGQAIAFKEMRPGVSGKELHEKIKRFFHDQGYPTTKRKGRWTGFFHGTGHGLGLEIHEEPRFGRTIFRPGQVLTVEPGLYFPGIGGVRIEDVTTITRTGIKMLSDFPKRLEL